ncbi:putative LigA [Streptomyces himastatinicus ATCC 53653]|uniref:Putative LigA n=1 Tax=Streptomyces himastatinicus ATCC 53653 TaxID=457427 RepID=D9WJ33_9ACTN|nr:putative LigA [Streptomyces himastatinicus ATCC 53653]
MTGDVWWERDAREQERADGRTVPGPGPTGAQPELVDATREAVRAAVRGRIAGYTPDWTDPDRQDAGVALVRLFGTLAEPVLGRVNRLPEKVLAEHLTTAGVRRRPAGAAAALLEFTVNPPDGASVLVPAGFQSAASTTAGQVVYETDQDLYATPATLGALAVQEAGRLETLPLGPSGPSRPFAPFGRDPEPGNGLWIGLAGPAGPYPRLSLGYEDDAAPPAPVFLRRHHAPAAAARAAAALGRAGRHPARPRRGDARLHRRAQRGRHRRTAGAALMAAGQPARHPPPAPAALAAPADRARRLPRPGAGPVRAAAQRGHRHRRPHHPRRAAPARPGRYGDRAAAHEAQPGAHPRRIGGHRGRRRRGRRCVRHHRRHRVPLARGGEPGRIFFSTTGCSPWTTTPAK